jgi:hypothetical protein
MFKTMELIKRLETRITGDLDGKKRIMDAEIVNIQT